MKKSVMKRIEKPEELNPAPGEDPRVWMTRNVQFWLTEIEKIALNSEASVKTRLDALKELTNKVIPPHSIQEIDVAQRENPMLGMSYEEVAAHIIEKHPRIAEEIEKKRKVQERKDSRSKKTLNLEYNPGN